MAKVSGSDEISQLPTCILQEILLRLPRRDEARCSVLSKSWNKLISSMLHERSFDFEECCPNQFRRYFTEHMHRNFMNYIDKSFKKLPEEEFIIAKFGLMLQYFDAKDDFLVDSWLALAAKYRVQSLSLNVGGCCWDNLSTQYKFPEIGLASFVPLLDLKLTDCALQQRSLCHLDNDKGAHFALKRLCLIEVVIENQDWAFQNFISRCTSLEYLRIQGCIGLKDLLLHSHNKLKELDVDLSDKRYRRRQGLRLEKVDVNSLSLETVRVDGGVHKPMVVVFSSCRKLQHLYITESTIEDQFVPNLAINFPLLKTLSLDLCKLNSLCVVRHPLLETLRLCRNRLVDVELNTPNLLYFEFNGCIIPKTLFLSNAPSYSSILKESSICIPFNSGLLPFSTNWFFQLAACLTQLNKHTVNLSLDMPTSLLEFNVGTFKGVPTLNLTCDVEFVELRILPPSESFAAHFFDGLFWCCRPKKVLFTEQFPIREILKVTCEIAKATQEDQGCCNSFHVKCWRHCLKVTAINDIDTTNTTSLEPLLQNICRLQNQCRNVTLTLSWS